MVIVVLGESAIGAKDYSWTAPVRSSIPGYQLQRRALPSTKGRFFGSLLPFIYDSP